MPNIEVLVLIGRYAQRWHLAAGRGTREVTETVANWREIYLQPPAPRIIVLPHPSWRNSSWLKHNPWFELELLPELRMQVQTTLSVKANQS
jgi:uracil-DNA glycosylase